MTGLLSLATLKAASLAQLEDIYRTATPAEWEPALWRGHFLHMIDSDIARNTAMRWISEVGFGHAPFWIDYERRLWCFGTPDIGMGRFSASLGPSRWRNTTTMRLEYRESRLPGLIRRELYDEVKPLSSGLCLGISGLNAERGRGDIFFFALTRDD